MIHVDYPSNYENSLDTNRRKRKTRLTYLFSMIFLHTKTYLKNLHLYMNQKLQKHTETYNNVIKLCRLSTLIFP